MHSVENNENIGRLVIFYVKEYDCSRFLQEENTPLNPKIQFMTEFDEWIGYNYSENFKMVNLQACIFPSKHLKFM